MAVPLELVEVCRDSQTKAVVNLHGEISVYTVDLV